MRKKKLFLLAAVLGLSLAASARSIGPLPLCDFYCPGKPASTVCRCSPGTPNAGLQTTCGAWVTACGIAP